MATTFVSDASEYHVGLDPVEVRLGIVPPTQAVSLFAIGAFGNANISKVAEEDKLSHPFPSVVVA